MTTPRRALAVLVAFIVLGTAAPSVAPASAGVPGPGWLGRWVAPGCGESCAVSATAPVLYVSPDGAFAYSADGDGLVVQPLGADGRIHGVSNVVALPSPVGLDAAFSPDGAFVYVVAGGAVRVLARDAATGQLAQLAGADGCIGPAQASETCRPLRGIVDRAAVLALAPDSSTLYVVDAGNVIVLDRDPLTGVLSQPDGPDGCVASSATPLGALCAPGGPGFREPSAIVLTATHAYVATAMERGGVDDGITLFTRDPQTGGLARVAGTDGCYDRLGAHGCTPLLAHRGGLVTVGGFLAVVWQGGRLDLLARDGASGALAAVVGAAGCADPVDAGCTPLSPGTIDLDGITSDATHLLLYGHGNRTAIPLGPGGFTGAATTAWCGFTDCVADDDPRLVGPAGREVRWLQGEAVGYSGDLPPECWSRQWVYVGSTASVPCYDPNGEAVTVAPDGPITLGSLSADGSTYTAPAGFVGDVPVPVVLVAGKDTVHTSITFGVWDLAPVCDLSGSVAILGRAYDRSVVCYQDYQKPFTVAAHALHGSATFIDGQLSYLADQGFVGVDTVSLTTTDGLVSAVYSLSIDVLPVTITTSLTIDGLPVESSGDWRGIPEYDVIVRGLVAIVPGYSTPVTTTATRYEARLPDAASFSEAPDFLPDRNRVARLIVRGIGADGRSLPPTATSPVAIGVGRPFTLHRYSDGTHLLVGIPTLDPHSTLRLQRLVGHRWTTLGVRRGRVGGTAALRIPSTGAYRMLLTPPSGQWVASAVPFTANVRTRKVTVGQVVVAGRMPA